MRKMLLLVCLIILLLSNLTQAIDMNASVYNFSVPDASIKLYSKNHFNFGSGNGESIELIALSPMAKPYYGWRTWDEDTKKVRGTGWVGCHYNLTNGNKHSHCSFETLDNTTGVPSINSHFEILYGGSLKRGYVGFPDADTHYTSDFRAYFGSSEQAWIGYRSGTNALEISAPQLRLNTKTVVIPGNSMLILQPNTTAMICGLATKGGLYMDGKDMLLRRCDGKRWRTIQ